MLRFGRDFLGHLYDKWMAVTLKQKINTFAAMEIVIIGLSIIFNIYTLNFALGGFKTILDDNSKSHDLQKLMEQESSKFNIYAKDRTKENLKELNIACIRMERALVRIPYDYNEIGTNRYARTWSIKNSYEAYSRQREYLLTMDPLDANYVEELYRTYRMQEFLIIYTKDLLQITLSEGNQLYQTRVPALNRMPYLILLLAVVLIQLAIYLTKVMAAALIHPIERLALVSKNIAENKFEDQDVVIANKDEMGDLVKAFNKMKHATIGYITTLEEKSQMMELIHHEELQKIEMEKRLDAAKLELLKSQLNPHFLFNTLNMIACMAKLEDADTTEKMIICMSNLFRYNLKTPETMVFLIKELQVVNDYMYIQRMRFGSRVKYQIICKVDADNVVIPSFTLQPIVENAIIHGISKKEQGGNITLRIWEKDNRLIISIADTGIGMDKERLAELKNALKTHATAKVGIGVGNIYKRIHSIYPDGRFEIYSRENVGTIVQMMIPRQL